jgi:hypothetical protein
MQGFAPAGAMTAWEKLKNCCTDASGRIFKLRPQNIPLPARYG